MECIMKKLFSKSESESEKSETTKTNEENYQIYRFSNNVSMKETGSEIDGVYSGIEVKYGQGIKGGNLYVIHFNKDDKDITCIAGAEILKFLENFKIGYYLHIKRIDTKLTKEGNKYAEYEFRYNPSGVKTAESFRLFDRSELPKKLNEAKAKDKTEDKTDVTN